MDGTRLADVQQFYELLSSLEGRIGGARRLGACNGQKNWPGRGVYFFMEDGEARSTSGTGPRVVRVGTHGLTAGARSTLWGRLSQHRGQQKTGGGNHRGSIFRLLVGTALIGRHGYDFATWGRGSNALAPSRALETALEREVSHVIRAMPFVWLAIGDEPGAQSLRGDIERNSIALLSNLDKSPIDPPSTGWLGRVCDRDLVRRSGLWNQRHVADSYDPGFLARMDSLVTAAGIAR